MSFRVNWNPTPLQEVVQNVRVLLGTAPGSVPLARRLGTPQDMVDMPVNIAGSLIQAAAIKAIRTFEPRVDIKTLELKADLDGKLDATFELVAP